MQIQENISLKQYNTFGIDVKARHFVSVSSIEDLKHLISLENYSEKFFLGGGSNMLLTKDIEALVIHLNLKGISILSENENNATIKANAGENWHEFVMWCLEHDFGGLENLSLIPGNVGTAPVQNIGAYGVELKDSFVECDVIDLKNLEKKTISKKECEFGYRDSIFKGKNKGQYIIVSVTFKMTKNHHSLHISYGAIISELKEKKVRNPSIKDVSNAIISIRQSKLPDPKKIGNSGSFFKNPVISTKQFDSLKKVFPEMPSYPVSETEIKIPAGWLIEKAGLKGKRFKNYGVHEKQALVLVNYGTAKGSDILGLAELIQHTVHRIFNISLETEVNIF